MGTNYYLQEKPPCDKCGREFERLHIGQSSAGWCFALHVIPELGINNLADWKKRWEEHPSVIRDEYGMDDEQPVSSRWHDPATTKQRQYIWVLEHKLGRIPSDHRGITKRMAKELIDSMNDELTATLPEEEPF